VLESDRSLIAIEDKVSIRELCARYNWYVDTFLIDPLMEVFVEDYPVFDETPVGLARSEGRADIRSYFEDGLFKQLKSMVHLTTNFFLEEHGANEAKGRCSAHVFAETHEGGKVEVLCWYDDVYRRTEGGWRFVSRVVHAYTPPNLAAMTGE
jgi:SnoaL-like domain